MSNEQSIRDAAAEWIAGLISGNGFGDDYVDDEVKQWADDLLASPVIRRIQAEAIREAAHELWRVTKDCDEHCDDDWRYRLQSKADAIERGETA